MRFLTLIVSAFSSLVGWVAKPSTPVRGRRWVSCLYPAYGLQRHRSSNKPRKTLSLIKKSTTSPFNNKNYEVPDASCIRVQSNDPYPAMA
jgi:hypothetical protein